MFLTHRILYRFAAKSKPIKTHYQMLQLPTKASQKQIKSHYIKLAKMYHPDIYKGSDKSRFEKIKTAYDTLSNVQKRRQYDRTIGIGNRDDNENMEGQGEQESKVEQEKYAKMKKKPRVKLDYSFDKTEAETIDLDEKYRQFFNKKVETPFEEIRIKENSWWNEMTEKERMQKTFTTIYNNPKHEIRTAHQDSFENILDEQIKQSNRYEEEVKEHQKKYEERRKEKNIRKVKRRYYFFFALLGLFTLPVIASIATREKIIKEEETKIVNKLNQIYDEDAEEKVRKRFQY